MGDLERLQQLFPSVDVEVVALVFGECDNNMSVTVEKLNEIAPQPLPQKLRDGVRPQDKDWPSLKDGRGSDHTPNANQPRIVEPTVGVAPNSQDWNQRNLKQDWNQSRKQEWNQVVKHGEQTGGQPSGRKGSGSKDVGGGYPISSEGPKIQTPFVPPGLGGANGTLFSPPEMDGRVSYWPPLNPGPGPLRHEVPGIGMQTRPLVHSRPKHPEMFTTGMGFGPRMPSRPPEVPGMGMGPRSRADVPYGQPQPAYMRWMGYGGVQDPNYPMGRDDRPRPFLQGMPRPPMQGGYNMPGMGNSYPVDGRMGDRLDMVGSDRMHGLVPFLPPNVSRSHSEMDVVGGRGSGSRGCLVLLRGLPGSGKTTLAKSLLGRNGVICSTDDFFMVNGKYVFDPSKLSEYHERNKMKARDAMKWGKSPVIIDNTNTSSWEMKPYILMAQELGYSVEIREPNTPWRFKTMELARRNKHGVTRAVLDKLLDRFEHRVSVESILQSESPPLPRKPQDTPTPGDEGRNGGPPTTKQQSSKVTNALSPKLTHKGSVNERGKELHKDSSSKQSLPLRKSVEAKSQVEKGLEEVLAMPTDYWTSAGENGPSGSVLKGSTAIAHSHEEFESMNIPNKEHQETNSAQKVSESGLYGKKSKKKLPAGNVAPRFANSRMEGVAYKDMGVAKLKGELEDIKNTVAMESRVAMDTKVKNRQTAEKRVKSETEAGGKGVKLASEMKIGGKGVKKNWPSSSKGPDQNGGVAEGVVNEDLWDSSEELDLSGDDEEEEKEKVDVEGFKEKGDVSEKGISKDSAVVNSEQKKLEIGSKLSAASNVDVSSSSEPLRLSTTSPLIPSTVSNMDPSRFSTDPSRSNTGPPQTSTDPPQTITSPPQTSTSPPKTSTDPPQTSTSPPQTSTDPPQTSTNPSKSTFSPTSRLSLHWQQQLGSHNNNNNTDIWKQSSTPFSSLGIGAGLVKKLRTDSVLQSALDSTLHQKYQQEGELDEKRLYSLKSQCMLTSQLISEHRAVCALAEDIVNPHEKSVVSIKAVVERLKVGGHHCYLSDHAVEQMFADRQLMPRIFPVVIPTPGPPPPPTGMELEQARKGNVTVREQSQLLKILKSSAGHENLDPNVEAGKKGVTEEVEDPAIVQRIPVDKGSVLKSGKSADVTKQSLAVVLGGGAGGVADEGSSPTLASSSDDNGVCKLDDPLPTTHVVPSVFPSALPSDSLDNLFNTFTTSDSVVSSVKSSQYLTPPQSPTVSQGQTKTDKELGDSNVGVVGGRGLQPTHRSSTVKLEELLAGSHDVGVVSHDLSTAKVKLLSVQELEQQMTSCDPRTGNDPETQFHSTSGGDHDNDVQQAGPEFDAVNVALNSSTGSVRKGEVLSSHSLPSLEHWTWQEGPTSLESWSPRSHTSSINDEPTIAADLANAAIPSGTGANIVCVADEQFGDPLPDRDERIPRTDSKTEILSNCDDLLAGLGSDIAEPSFETDLAFLVECFPDLDESYLEQLLMKNSGNMEDTVSMALLSVATTDATTPLSPYFNFSRSYLPQTSDESGVSSNFAGEGSLTSLDIELDDSNLNESLDDIDTANDEEIARALQDSLDGGEVGVVVGGVGDGYKDVGVLHLESESDEQVARALQEKLNQNDTGAEGAQPQENGVHYLEGYGEEDNLVLKLTPSLAHQLQQLFGLVEDHIPHQGKVTDSDLEVLLSERAAKEIYKKWIDTLKAKQEAHQVHSQLLLGASKTPEHSPHKEASKKKKKKKKFSGKQILVEEKVQQATPPSVWEHPHTPSSASAPLGGLPPQGPGPLRSLLQRLYQQFPLQQEKVINRVLIDNSYDEAQTTEQLTLIQSGKVPAPVVSVPEPVKPRPHFTAPPSFTYRLPPFARGKKIETRVLRRDETEERDIKSPYQMLKDPSYNDMRAEAALHAKLRAESFQKAAHARSKKQYEVATYYAQQGHMHTDKMKEANKLAANYTLSLLNENCSSNQIDLHGLHVNEALDALKEKIQRAKPGSKLHVVTGYGSRSKSKEAKIKPAVLSLLKSYDLKYVEKNPGLLQVEMKK